jgi:hypothetical protein
MVRDFLSSLVKTAPAVVKPLVIETNLTKSEKAIIAAGRKERIEHPESFISLDDYLKTRGIDKQALMAQGGEGR